jgi:hypothetical protein
VATVESIVKPVHTADAGVITHLARRTRKCIGIIHLGDETVADEVENKEANKEEHKETNKEAKFDWVAARSACTLPKVYRQLMAEIEEDVKVRNAQRPDNSPYEFSMEEKGPQFSVILKAADFRRAITFCYEDHAIIVVDASGNQMFEVTLLFTDDGKCRLKAKEENRDSWQVRRMALEDLLFRTI